MYSTCSILLSTRLRSCLQALQQGQDRQTLRSAVEHVTGLHERRIAAGPRPLVIHGTGQQQRLEGLLQVAVQIRHRQQRRACAWGDNRCFASSGRTCDVMCLVHAVHVEMMPYSTCCVKEW